MGSVSKVGTAALKAGAAAALSVNNKILEQKSITKNKNPKIDKNIFLPQDGRLPHPDTIAREKGYENYKELEEYQKKNPHTFIALDGNNCISLNEKGKFKVSEAQKRDAYIKSLQHIVDKEDALRAQSKRSNNIPLTDREIEAEINLQWLKYGLNSDQIGEAVKKAKEINSAVVKFNNGEAINEKELKILTENGAQNFIGNNSYNVIDFLAEDNPQNIAAKEKYKNAVDKEKVKN